ncbi:MAG TPA: serine protease, partial [Candidatus Obscuribacterales bacterium]
MALEDSASIRHSAAEAAGAFAESFVDVFKRPLHGAEQLAGSQLAAGKQQAPESTAANVGHTAGSILGNAILFVGMTSALGRIPGIGRAAAYAAGGALGFLQPTSDDQGIGKRFANAALGAGTVGLLDVGPTALGLAKSSWVPGSQVAGLIPESQLGRIAMANAGVGALNTQLDSVIHNGHAAGLGQTLLGSALWAGTGLGAHGFGAMIRGDAPPLLSRTQVDAPPADSANSAPPAVPLEPQSATVRIAETGLDGPIHKDVAVPANSPTAQIFDQANKGALRIETLVLSPVGIENRVASGFAASDTAGQKLAVTTNHLIDGDMSTDGVIDVSIFDNTGGVTRASVARRNPNLDVSVLRPEQKTNWQSMQLADRPVEDIAAQDSNFLVAGYPLGTNRLTLMSGTYSHTGPQEAWIRVPTEQEGVCGSACFGLSDGTVAGMYRNAAAWHSGLSRLTVASDISKLVESVGNKPSLSVVEKPGVQIRSSFSLPDKYAAIQSFKNILDKKFPDRTEPDFMHSHIIRVPVDLNDGLHQLAMQIQYLPTQRQMSLRPVALDN